MFVLMPLPALSLSTTSRCHCCKMTTSTLIVALFAWHNCPLELQQEQGCRTRSSTDKGKGMGKENDCGVMA